MRADILAVAARRIDSEGYRNANMRDIAAEAEVAPMPGQIVSVNVAEGDEVQADQVLVVLEAMKMEH